MRLPGSSPQLSRASLFAAARGAAVKFQAIAKAAPTRLFGKVLTPVCILLVALFAVGATSAHAQAAYTAKRAGDLQVGGGFTFGSPDYDRPKIKGGSFYTSFDFKSHYGVELDFHQANAPSPSTLYERSYEAGGRYVRHYGIFNPYARLMYGRGVFNYEYNVANLAYNMADAALGVDIHASRHVNVRADYEFQHWFGFRGNLNDPGSSSLSPQLFTIGAAYHFE